MEEQPKSNETLLEKGISIYHKYKNVKGLVAVLGTTTGGIIALVLLLLVLVVLAVIILMTVYLLFTAEPSPVEANQGMPGSYYDSPNQLDVDGQSFAWPVPTISRISSPFGPRTHPVSGEVGKAHNGIDIANGPDKTELQPIYSMADGHVIVAGAVSGYGYAIYIEHAGGLKTIYGHLDSNITVSVGQQIKKGERIGRIGAGKVGSSTGPHLHFQVELNGVAVNPLNYISPPSETGFGDWKPPTAGDNGNGGQVNTITSLAYRPLNIDALASYLNGRQAMMGDRSILQMIDTAGKVKGIDPYVLLAITGAEQSFVPRSNPKASLIVKNPWNVFGCWCKGKGATLTTEQAAEIAANTIIKLSQGTPAGMDPLEWINQPSGVNPRGYYASDSTWWIHVSQIRADLYKRGGVIP